MKKVIKVLAIVLSLVMMLSAFAACGPKEPQKEEKKVTDGIFTFKFGNDGKDYNFYLHLYENGMFYLSELNGGAKVIGNWKLVDGEKEIEYAATRDDKVNNVVSKITVKQTLEFTNLDGENCGQAGWVPEEGKLYGLVITGGQGFGNTQVYEQQPSDWVPGTTEGVEIGQALFTYEDKADTSCYVSINHDGTFVDMMTTMIEGSWTKDGNTYTLTDPDSSAKATLTVNGDTADYVGYDGTKTTITKQVKESGGGDKPQAGVWTCADVGASSKNFKVQMTGSTTCKFSFEFMAADPWVYECNCEIIEKDGVRLIKIDENYVSCNGEARTDGSSADQVWNMGKNWLNWQLNDDGTMELK